MADKQDNQRSRARAKKAATWASKTVVKPASKAGASPTRTKPAAGTSPRPQVRQPDFGPVVEAFGPRLRAEFDELARSERAIVRGLADPVMNKLFLTDPSAALERLGVSVPPIIRQRLKTQQATADVFGPRSFRLPDGQVVTATVNVSFTSGRKGS